MIEKYINKKYLAGKEIFRNRFNDAKPYPHLVLKDFFDVTFLKKVLAEIRELDFSLQNSDLYTFYQSSDLSNIDQEFLKEFYKLINSKEFKDFIFDITGLECTAKIDASCFIYNSGSYLLPHDDQLDNRKVAYVVNFSDLSNNTGGSLDFFDEDKIVKSIVPCFEKFAKL